MYYSLVKTKFYVNTGKLLHIIAIAIGHYDLRLMVMFYEKICEPIKQLGRYGRTW